MSDIKANYAAPSPYGLQESLLTQHLIEDRLIDVEQLRRLDFFLWDHLKYQVYFYNIMKHYEICCNALKKR